MIEAGLFKIFDFFANNKYARWALVIVTGWFLVMWWSEYQKGVGRKLERAEQKRREAETRVRIAERTDQIVTEERQNADEALQARDSGEHYPDYNSLPDEFKAIAEGRARPRR